MKSNESGANFHRWWVDFIAQFIAVAMRLLFKTTGGFPHPPSLAQDPEGGGWKRPQNRAVLEHFQKKFSASHKPRAWTPARDPWGSGSGMTHYLGQLRS